MKAEETDFAKEEKLDSETEEEKVKEKVFARD